MIIEKNIEIQDMIGIGIGPFNLSLAALAAPILNCKALFFDESPSFNWHPGLLIDDATLQAPFMADLVTMADPTNPLSFLNYLKLNNRIYKFYIRENFFALRKEYNKYCQWAVTRLPNCKFHQKVTHIIKNKDLYEVEVIDLNTQESKRYYTRKIILGTGTKPYIPATLRSIKNERIIHTSDYLYHKDAILKLGQLSIIGSGQSAAEIIKDLLPYINENFKLDWVTRSDRFFPLENLAKLTLEMTSPEYIDYFFSLEPEVRKNLIAHQNPLYKGINTKLINEIFDTLYEKSVEEEAFPLFMTTNSELIEISYLNQKFNLLFQQQEQNKTFKRDCDFLIMATGYKYQEPDFLQGISHLIQRNPDNSLKVARNYTVDAHANEIFVQNVSVESHGLATPDLGMGAYRNAYILNKIFEKEIYAVEQKIAFQTFTIT